MRGIVALGLVGLSLLTAARLPAWRDNVHLWRAAVTVAPDLPRPALNYGVALIKAGDHGGGAIWLRRAAILADLRRGPRDREVLYLVSKGFVWIEAFGTPVCSNPDYQRYC